MSKRFSPSSSTRLSPPSQPPVRRRSVQWADYTNGGSLTLTKVVSPLPEAYFRSPVRDDLHVPESSSPTLPNLRGQPISLSSTFNPNRSSTTTTSSANYSSSYAFSNDFDADLLSAESRDIPQTSGAQLRARTSTNSALDRAAAWLSVTQRKQNGPIKAFAAAPGNSVSLTSRQNRADEVARLGPLDIPVLQQSTVPTVTSRVRRTSASLVPSTAPPTFNNSLRVTDQASSSRLARSPGVHASGAASPFQRITSSPAPLQRVTSNPSPLSATLNSKNTILPVPSLQASDTALRNSARAPSPIASSALPSPSLRSPAPTLLALSQHTYMSEPRSARNLSQTASLPISQQRPIKSSSSRSSGSVIAPSLPKKPFGGSLDNSLNRNSLSTSLGRPESLSASLKRNTSIRPPSPAPRPVLSARLTTSGPNRTVGAPIRATVPLPSELPVSSNLRQGAMPPPLLNSSTTSLKGASTSYLSAHQNRSSASINTSSPGYTSPAITRSSSIKASPSSQHAPSPSSSGSSIRNEPVQRPESLKQSPITKGRSIQNSPATTTNRTLSSSEAAFTQSIKSHEERIAGWKQSAPSLAPSPLPPPPPPPHPPATISIQSSARVTTARGKEAQAPRSPRLQQKVPRARTESSRSGATTVDSTKLLSSLPTPPPPPPPPPPTLPPSPSLSGSLVNIKNDSSILNESTLCPSSNFSKQVLQEPPIRPQFQVRPLGAPVTGQPLIQTPLRAQTSALNTSSSMSSFFSSPMFHRISDSPRMSSTTKVVNSAQPPRRASLGSFASPVVRNVSVTKTLRVSTPLSSSLRNAAPIRLSSTLRENKESRVSPIKADKPRRG